MLSRSTDLTKEVGQQIYSPCANSTVLTLDLKRSRYRSLGAVSDCFIENKVWMESRSVITGYDLLLIPDVAFLSSFTNHMVSTASYLSSYSVIDLILDCSAELHCPHIMPNIF